ncbi:hypothetical protein STENM223S_08552 [Streptomyces tendae]
MSAEFDGPSGRQGKLSQWLRGRRPKQAAGDGGREALLLAAVEAGLPLAPAAHPAGYRCSCDRVGCPTPARHPVSFAWQTQSTTDRGQIERWARHQPQANFITATGMVHDVLDVPFDAGREALAGSSRPGSRSARSPRATTAACCSSPSPAAPPRTRTSGGPASWTATRRPWTSIPDCAGTAGAPTSSSPRPASPATTTRRSAGYAAPSIRCPTR